MTTVVSVAQGGTGSNSAALARTALGVPPSAAYDQANTARDQANTARTQANSAYAQANSAYSDANTRLSASGGTLAGDLIITGNLTVSGNSTTLNAEILTIEDADVVLLSNVASTPALNAGIIVNRGTSTNTFLRWDEVTDKWGWSDDGSTTYKFNSALDAYAQANSAYGAANNAVLKAGDTMTGQLNISAGGLLVTGNSNFDSGTLFVDSVNDRIGIGMTNPNNARLHASGVGTGPDLGTTAVANATAVFGNSDRDYGMYFAVSGNGNGAIQQRRGATAVYYDLLLQPYGGNVGVANSAPLNKLQIGSGGTSGFAGNDLMIGNGTQVMAFYQSATESAWYTNTRFALMPSGAGASGNVGINTTSPAHKLDVNGTSIFRDTLNFGSGALISWTSGYGDGSTQTIQSPSSGSLALITNAATAMFIKSNQNIGIGTASPFSKLQVGSHTFSGGNGVFADSRAGITLHGSLTSIMYASTYNDSTYPDYGLVFVHGANTSNYNVWSLSPDGPAKGNSLNFIYGSNATNIHTGTPKVVFRGDGNVGIGTTNPSAKLDIEGSGAVGLLHINNTTAGKSGMVFQDNGTQKLIIGLAGIWEGNSSTDAAIATESGSNIRFYTNGSATERMRINTNGRVGIANTNPERTLHVEGISYNRGTIIRPTVYGGDNSGTTSTIGSYILGAGKYWTVSSGAKYVHILLPARYNANAGASLMWCIEVKGYDFNAARIINLMIGGYVTTVSNGGPMSQVAAWDSAGAGVYNPTAYFSSNYNVGIARFYLSSSYYASFTINTIASGNGDVIAPDELTIIESVNATI